LYILSSVEQYPQILFVQAHLPRPSRLLHFNFNEQKKAEKIVSEVLFQNSFYETLMNIERNLSIKKVFNLKENNKIMQEAKIYISLS